MRSVAGILLLLVGCLPAWGQVSNIPRPGSCQPWWTGEIEDPCGTRWQAGGIATDIDGEDGCSCESDCGYKGTCCFDASSYCQSQEIFGYAPPTPSSGGFDTLHMDGEQWIQVVRPATISSLNGTTVGNTLGGFRFIGLAPEENRFAGLTKVGFSAFQPKDASVGCYIKESPDVAGNPHLYVAALSACGDWDLGDNGETWVSRYCDGRQMKSTCSAMALAQPPVALGDVFVQGPSTTLYTGCENSTVDCDNEGYKDVALGPIVDGQGNESFPLLERVTMTEYDRIWSDRWPSIRCQIHESGGEWWLKSFSDQTNGDAICRASLITETTGQNLLPETCPQTEVVTEFHDGGQGGGACDEGDATIHFWAQSVGGGYDLDPDQTAGRPQRENYSEVSMFSDTTHTCFLHTYLLGGEFRSTTYGDDRGTCQVYERNSKWWLRAQHSGTEDGSVWCEARCLRIPDSDSWSRPTPERNGAAYGYRWPPAPFHVAESENTRARADLTGPHMELFQYGDYDRPMLIIEGFDANNERSVGDTIRDFSPLIRLARQYGIDLWIMDFPEGGAPLDELARQVAMAIQYAWRYDNWIYAYDGMPVVGFSQGGLAGRMSLAYYEQGRFADPSDPLYLSDSYGSPWSPWSPFVSHFASVGSPHEGANIPLTLQVLIQDIGGDFSLGNPHRALNAAAAKEILTARINQDCNGVVTEWCEGNRVLVDDATVECDEVTTCGQGTHRCDIDESQFVDTGSLWPTSPSLAGISNAGWGLQSCERLPETEREECIDRFGFDEFDTTDAFGYIRYQVDGPFYNCDRDSTIVARVSERDRVHGDLAGGTFSGITIDGVPKEVTVLEIEQYLPYLFIPTNSALACPGDHDDDSCRAANRANGRFDHIASNPEPSPDGISTVNGFHDTLDYRLAHELLAFAVEAFDEDGDGWCDPAVNPVLSEFNAKLGVLPEHPLGLSACLDPEPDCNAADDDAFPGAPEVCDDVDNDCNGGIDEGFPDKGALCDNGLLGACYREGILVCNSQGDGYVCSADPDIPPGIERCNGIDDDCDGEIDDGCIPSGGSPIFRKPTPSMQDEGGL